MELSGCSKLPPIVYRLKAALLCQIGQMFCSRVNLFFEFP